MVKVYGIIEKYFLLRLLTYSFEIFEFPDIVFYLHKVIFMGKVRRIHEAPCPNFLNHIRKIRFARLDGKKDTATFNMLARMTFSMNAVFCSTLSLPYAVCAVQSLHHVKRPGSTGLQESNAKFWKQVKHPTQGHASHLDHLANGVAQGVQRREVVEYV